MAITQLAFIVCVCVCLSVCVQEVMLQLSFDLLSWELDEPQEEGETFFSCLWLEWDSVDPVGSQGETVPVTRRLPIYSRQVRTHLLCYAGAWGRANLAAWPASNRQR